ncbi:hypothetical protein PAHAL_3G092600 [Panicum hallii]|uniref:Uncharacterized protein n=1 Tax=Panicum hallii TaxID=206008 RepID=A0A2T8KHL7_9POAL|nr:hypothetical protein PAHAL_3G092600 [Panicum hallii]
MYEYIYKKKKHLFTQTIICYGTMCNEKKSSPNIGERWGQILRIEGPKYSLQRYT